MTASEDQISTTLLVLPFAFAKFSDFYKFSLKIEDIVLPQLERSTRLTANDQEPEVQVNNAPISCNIFKFYSLYAIHYGIVFIPWHCVILLLV